MNTAVVDLDVATRSIDWRDGKKSVQENGLHYLLNS